MRSLLGRLTLSHLLVSLGAVLLVTALSPPLFRAVYIRTEQQRLQAAADGLGRAAEGLLTTSRDTRSLEVLISTSAEVIGGDVHLDLGDRSFGRVQRERPGQPPRLRAMVELQQPGGVLTVSKPLTGLPQIIRAQRMVTALAALLAVVLAVALAYLSARAVSAPLVAMAAAARRLADGDFSVKVPEVGPGEVHSLAVSMNHMAESLASLDALRREFVANASHELRAPLTAVQGFLQAILDGTATTEEERQHCLKTAEAEALRMSRLVEDLLQLSRLQAGVLEFQLTPGDLRPLAERVIAAVKPRLVQKKLRVEVEAGELPQVAMDSERLAQVLTNLLDNAIRFSPQGGLLRVTMAASESGVRFAVADEGPGIPEDDLQRIWDRFHKVDPARRRTDPGAGLGLAIAKEIVTKHGGEVFALNREGGGAEIGFLLPAL